MMNVLVVDDDRVALDGISRLIAASGKNITVHSATTGYEALQICQTPDTRPSIVFADIQMPGMNGLEMIRYMKDIYRIPVIIVISGHAEFKYAQRALQLSVTDYLLKPVSVSMFNQVFTNACELVQVIRYQETTSQSTLQDLDSLRRSLMGRLMLGKEAFTPETLAEQMQYLSLSPKAYLLGFLWGDASAEAVRMKLDVSKILMPAVVHTVRDGERGCAVVMLYEKEMDGVRRAALIRELYEKLEAVPGQLFVDDGENLLDIPKKFFALREQSLRQMQADREDDPSWTILSNRHTLSPIVILAVEYVVANYMRDITMEGTAKHVHVHPTYLSDLFKRETGYTFTGFLGEYRICCAKRLLRKPGCKIQEVALQAGFRDQRYFSRVFKKLCGVTPMEYRAEFFRKTPFDDQVR